MPTSDVSGPVEWFGCSIRAAATETGGTAAYRHRVVSTHGARKGCESGMARRRGLGLLGWIAVIVLILILVAYLQQHHLIHLPATHH